MTPVALVNAYLVANCLIAFVVFLVGGARALGRRLSHPFAYRDLLRWSYALVVAAMLLPAVVLWSDPAPVVPHVADVFSAPTMQQEGSSVEDGHLLALAAAPEQASIDLSAAARIAGWILAGGFVAMLVLVIVDMVRAVLLLGRASLVRQRGAAKILSSDEARVPFSFWIPGRYYIVVPATLLLQPSDLRLAIGHEAQHHRQADTKVLYVCQLVRALCWWNPAIHVLTRQLRELQEFACDEGVLRRRRGSALDYCRCLLAVAEDARARRRGLLSAAMASGGQHVLLRRIEAALRPPTYDERRREVAAAGVAALVLSAALATSIAAPIQDRRIAPAEAQRMARIARADSAFPIAMNTRVLEQLNLLLGTPDGRAYLRAGLDRMDEYEPMIQERIDRFGLPRELMAVPLVEAGYRNLPAGSNPRHGAGLWMFIESTARRFGLAVTGTEDQRLDEPRQTDAAMRMLSALYSQFGDWELALLAYNGGEWRVRRGIEATGSNDAWTLVEAGHENDPNYLARVTAAILIIKNPALLE